MAYSVRATLIGPDEVDVVAVVLLDTATMAAVANRKVAMAVKAAKVDRNWLRWRPVLSSGGTRYTLDS